MHLKTELDTGGPFPFPIRWVIVDSQARETFESLDRSEQVALAALVKSDTFKYTRDPNTLIRAAGVYDQMRFHLFAVEDEREPPGPAHPSEDENAVVTLVWSESPQDLDLHLLVTSSERDAHLWYRSQGDIYSYPWARLDQDITSGRGPETIAIGRLTNAKYKVFVHNFSRQPSILDSGARISVVSRQGRVEFECPTAGVGDWWIVCEVNGVTGEITSIDELSTMAPFTHTMEVERK